MNYRHYGISFHFHWAHLQFRTELAPIILLRLFNSVSFLFLQREKSYPLEF